MIEWVFLLLPAAAASGWWAARRSTRRAVQGSGAPDPAFFRGLNYLVDDQPDKAIDVFVKLAEVDGEAAEIHLALGGLFRRRGEVDRAIRVHQSLIARPDLDRQVRAFALYELGQDYMRAGLFDRAERLFNELAEIKAHRRRALEGLLEIYQQEKEWGKCMEVAERLQQVTRAPISNEIAQYHCELAEEALRAGDDALAKRCLKDARMADPSCVRATMLQARIAMDGGDLERAGTLYLEVASQGERLLPEVLPGLLSAYRQRPKGELLVELRRLHEEHPSAPLALTLADILERTEGPQASAKVLVDYLKDFADLAALERLLELPGLGATGVGDARQGVTQAVRRVVRHLSSRQPKYQCDHCGFVAWRLHWQCPSCRRWGGIQPVQPPRIGSPPSSRVAPAENRGVLQHADSAREDPS